LIIKSFQNEKIQTITVVLFRIKYPVLTLISICSEIFLTGIHGSSVDTQQNFELIYFKGNII